MIEDYCLYYILAIDSLLIGYIVGVIIYLIYVEFLAARATRVNPQTFNKPKRG